MRSNSGNPTLGEHEQARSRSGEAITGDKKVGGEPSRTESRSKTGSP